MAVAIQVVTTTASREDADTLALTLVRRRLAACAQVYGPIESTFHWQGVVETKEEWMCVLKSDDEHYGHLEAAIRELHSYDTPEILALPVLRGYSGYLDWLHGELANNQGKSAGGP